MYPKILINSHKNNKKALDLLLFSIDKYNDLFDIIIVVGGFYELEDYEINYDKNRTIINANHNSIDFTALITVMELNIDEKFLYLHDTCEIGENFINILKKIDCSNIFTIGHPSMNMGLYDLKTLIKYENILKKLKNIDKNMEIKFKNLGYTYEGRIFQFEKAKQIGKNPPYISIGFKQLYDSNVQRRIDYIECLDLYKYKANYPGHKGFIKL